MAEYIDRNLIEWYGCNFEEPSCKNRECSGCSHAECSHTQVMQIPPADVIESSKIDKAIEEMEIKYNNIDYHANKLLGASYGIRKSIEILKKNIEGDYENRRDGIKK